MLKGANKNRARLLVRKHEILKSTTPNSEATNTLQKNDYDMRILLLLFFILNISILFLLKDGNFFLFILPIFLILLPTRIFSQYSKLENSIFLLLNPLLLSFFISLGHFIFRKINNIDMPFFELFLFVFLWMIYYIADIFILLSIKATCYIVNKLHN